jgi:hypothetical protein
MAKKPVVGSHAPVTERALVQRINRRLAKDFETLKAARGGRWRSTTGDYYVVDLQRNAIARTNVDPEALGRELGVLHAYERVVEE